MNVGRMVFAQVIEHLPHKEFQKCVARYGGDRYSKNFSCWDQYLAMAFAQLTYRESLHRLRAAVRADAQLGFLRGAHNHNRTQGPLPSATNAPILLSPAPRFCLIWTAVKSD
jgi:Domain of unknown function (DUF4372)